MSQIFISYRRDDNAIAANAIYDRLVQIFGVDSVFFDIKMPLGVDWEIYLGEQVDRCMVMLVVIGRDWLTAYDPDNGERRLDQENDTVRYEIATGLKRNIPVIPLFLDGVKSLPSGQLPDSIKALAKRQGQVIRRAPDFDGDLERLVAQLKAMVEVPIRTSSVYNARKFLSRGLLPQPFDWVRIPGKGYNISKYPVTNAQFKLFVDAGGYKDRQWWTDAGWIARAKGWLWEDNDYIETGRPWEQPLFWDIAQWNAPEQPVVGVSWHEVIAYSRWLSQLTGESVSIPTEDQWQFAAQGDDNREFPWGNSWDCRKCNNSEPPCVSDKTTPVHQYEGVGDSPFGVVDMVGNVWEWCLNLYQKPQIIDLNTVGARSLRGGSWLSGSNYTRVSCRLGNLPVNRVNGIGFRLVLVLN